MNLSLKITSKMTLLYENYIIRRVLWHEKCICNERNMLLVLVLTNIIRCMIEDLSDIDEYIKCNLDVSSII